MQLKIIKKKISLDLYNVQTIITSNLFSNIPFINSSCFFFEKNEQGKLFRSIVLLLISRALGYTGQQHVWFAAIIELIHLATLIHDDVVDQASVRRGMKTFNAQFGNTRAVLFGDFIYSKAFQMMAISKDLKILRILSNATNRIAEGEIFQLQNIGNVYITPKEYMLIIENKTAVLFEATALIASQLSKNITALQQREIQSYGRTIGLIYQLVDDIQDYNKKKIFTGKFQGKDLLEGKVTLPLILAFSTNLKYKKKAEIIFNNNSCKKFSLLYEFVLNSNSQIYINRLLNYLINEAQKSINVLQNSLYKQSLLKLPEILVCELIKKKNEMNEI